MSYLYQHIRLDTNEIFYIGVGSDNDYKRSKSKARNAYWNNIVAKTDYRVEIVLDGLSNEEAYNKEIEYIKLYGRKDKNLGTLCNLTDGGNGAINYKHSENIKLSLAEIMIERHKKLGHNITGKGKYIPTGVGSNRLGLLHTEISKEKMRLNSPRRKQTEEIRKIISQSKLKDILDITTGIYYKGAKEACKAFNLNESTLRSRLNGGLLNNTNLIYV